jgi:type II secretory pathway predicted ATPase ExeA
MKDRLARAAAAFEDCATTSGYYESASAESARRVLRHVIDEDRNLLLFLLGEPGTGKTRMLHLLKESYESSRQVVLISDPFESSQRLLHKLGDAMGLERLADFDRMRESVAEAYRKTPHLILVDEAQLITEKGLEFIRILFDTGAFRFVLAMHRREGEEILAKPHFRSRGHRVVEMGALKPEEVEGFVRQTLSKEGLDDQADRFKPRHFKMIHRYGQGNFRMTKRIMQSLFLLMAEAHTLGYAKMTAPNDTLLCMAAMDTGAIDG